MEPSYDPPASYYSSTSRDMNANQMYPPYAPANTSSEYTGNIGQGVNCMVSSPGFPTLPNLQAGRLNMQSPYETHPYPSQIYNSSNSAYAQPLAGPGYPPTAGSSYLSCGAMELQYTSVAGTVSVDSGSAQWIGYSNGREGTIMTTIPAGCASNPAMPGANAYVNTSHYNASTPNVEQQQGYDSTVSNQASLPRDMGISGAMLTSSPYNLATHNGYELSEQPIQGHAHLEFACADQLYPPCAPQVIQDVNHIFNSSNSECAQPPVNSSYPPAASLYPSSEATVGSFLPWTQHISPLAGTYNYVPYYAPDTVYGLNPALNTSHYNGNTPYIPPEQQGYNTTPWIHASMPGGVGPSGGMQMSLNHNLASQGEYSRNAHLYCPVDCTVYSPGCQPAWAQRDSIYLDKAYILERPVESLQSSYQDGQGKGKGRLGVHHLAVFQLACGHSFVVEKIAEAKHSEILECDHAKYTSGGPSASTRLRIMVDLKVASVPVRDFKNILKHLGEKYKLLSDNCWSYSYGTVKGAIKLCQKAANLSSAHRKFLQEELKRLKHVKRIMPRTVLMTLLPVAAVIAL
ncbi:hypothetical protein M758_3G186300 [Ceratodon purpureus]|nr:hypothetical protein M758_3G186300 [Ceratodon purpureus]